MTIDVEDYFQVSAFAPHIRREDWDSLPCRVERNVDVDSGLAGREHRAHATFFTLGWIAERYPARGAAHRRQRPRTRQPRLRPPARVGSKPERISAGHHPRQEHCWRTSAASRCAAIARRAFPSAGTTCGRSRCCGSRLSYTAPASIRSGTTITACPMRRALPHLPAMARAAFWNCRPPPWRCWAATCLRRRRLVPPVAL